MASDALEEEEGEVCLKRVMHPSKSHMLDELLLDTYAVHLEESGRRCSERARERGRRCKRWVFAWCEQTRGEATWIG